MTTSTQTTAGVVPEWTIGDRLRKARERTGLERGEFAEEIGISRNTVTNYEREKVEPRLIVLRAWALRSGVDVDWLMHGEPGPPDAHFRRPTNPCLSVMRSNIDSWVTPSSTTSVA